MSVLIVDEQNKKRIQKYIRQEIGFYGYEQDIELLEQKGELTAELARKVFGKVMDDAHRTRTILEPEEDSEFKEEIEEAFKKYDKISKPSQFEEYGWYESSYSMEMEDIYGNMQTAFELRELDNKYYRCRDLRYNAESAINSINGIEKYQIELYPETKAELNRIQAELKGLLSAPKTDIKSIQEMIELYNQHATNIWNVYLTGIDDIENSQFRWVVHNLTKGELQGDFRNKYMSTSLITNNAMGRYGRSDYGLIIKPKHIVSASYKDTYTLNEREDEENLFNILPPLMLPQEIEDICIQQTIEENGEMLNYETETVYSELVVDEFEIEGVYYISNGEKELAKDYERAKKVADERGVPLVERDVSKYRAQNGLEPMTEKTKRNLCRNILWKCCVGDEELESLYNQFADSFVNNNYKDFYQKFMELKEKPEFSKEDILRVFSDIAKEDLIFSKISQNINDMYSIVELPEEEIEKGTESENKTKFINLFLNILEKNEEVKQYISVDEARRILNENIKEVIVDDEETGKGITENATASYSLVSKVIRLSKSVDINRMNKEDIRNCIHEILHALTMNIQFEGDNVKGFSGVEYLEGKRNARFSWQIEYNTEKGRGLDEGITEWLARRLVGKDTGIAKDNIYEMCGIRYNDIGASYAGEQLLIEELAILYGEDKIINAYLNNDIPIITKAIAKSTKITNPEAKFEEFSDLLDSFIETEYMDNFISKEYRRDIKNQFSGIQDFFVEEFLEKEISGVLENNDEEKIKEIKVKLERLLALNIDIKGKGSPFISVVEKFNEQIKDIGLEYEIPLKKETILDKIKKSFSRGNIMDKVFCIVEPIGNFISKYRNNQLTIPETTAVAVGPVLKPISPKKDIIEEIRGVPQEEYEEACKNAENKWEEREKSQEHDERSVEIEW